MVTPAPISRVMVTIDLSEVAVTVLPVQTDGTSLPLTMGLNLICRISQESSRRQVPSKYLPSRFHQAIKADTIAILDERRKWDNAQAGASAAGVSAEESPQHETEHAFATRMSSKTDFVLPTRDESMKVKASVGHVWIKLGNEGGSAGVADHGTSSSALEYLLAPTPVVAEYNSRSRAPLLPADEELRSSMRLPPARFDAIVDLGGASMVGLRLSYSDYLRLLGLFDGWEATYSAVEEAHPWYTAAFS